jgi:hypothetical protein
MYIIMKRKHHLISRNIVQYYNHYIYDLLHSKYHIFMYF